MDNQIETRCAVEAKCEVDSSGRHYNDPKYLVTMDQFNNGRGDKSRWFSTKELKFTTDRNWCQLLVDECRSKKYGLEEFFEELAKILGWKGLTEYYYGEDITINDQVEEMFLATPEQICLAALATLEGESENE